MGIGEIIFNIAAGVIGLLILWEVSMAVIARFRGK